ncbi:MAG: hypothetical protein AAB621_03420, partial [Patescibacteria group bacterium]
AITSSEGAIGSQQSVCTRCYIGFAVNSDRKSCVSICEKNNTINRDGKACSGCVKAKKDIEDFKKSNSSNPPSEAEIKTVKDTSFPNYDKDCR